MLAILLTISGIYGVLSYLVEQRRREIGVRVALGATAASVVAMVLKQGLRLASAGIVVGAVLGVGAWKRCAGDRGIIPECVLALIRNRNVGINILD